MHEGKNFWKKKTSIITTGSLFYYYCADKVTKLSKFDVQFRNKKKKTLCLLEINPTRRIDVYLSPDIPCSFARSESPKRDVYTTHFHRNPVHYWQNKNNYYEKQKKLFLIGIMMYLKASIGENIFNHAIYSN